MANSNPDPPDLTRQLEDEILVIRSLRHQLDRTIRNLHAMVWLTIACIVLGILVIGFNLAHIFKLI